MMKEATVDRDVTHMKRIMIFGKPGGGKSTLAKRLSNGTGIPHYPLDLIQYRADGTANDVADYKQEHAEWIAQDQWIIDGFGTLDSFWQRIEAAPTQIYIDLPYRVHYWWVIKRLLKSPFAKPEGWPDGASAWKGTMASVKYLRLSRLFWRGEMFARIQAAAKGKTVLRIRSLKMLNRPGEGGRAKTCDFSARIKAMYEGRGDGK